MASRFPVPPVPYRGYSRRSFATSEQVHSRLFLAGYDRGELALTPGRVVFTGMTALVDCPDVTSVRVVNKAFPWAVTLAVGGVAAARAFAAAPGSTVPAPFAALLAVIFGVACFRQAREQWVEVAYLDPAGGPARAYFRDSGRLTESGRAATLRLRDEIIREVRPPAAE
jgi:hypothetical protein